MSEAPDKAVAGLEKLASDPAQHTKMARFRRLLPSIEKALSSGARRAAVLEVLAAEGLKLSPSMFNKYLTQARRAAPGSRKPPAQSAVRAAPPSPDATGDNEFGSHDPRAIDAIIKSPVDLNQLAKLTKGKK